MDKSFFKHSLIYIFGRYFSSFVTFLLLPIISRNLTISEFGVYGIILAIGIVVSYFFNFSALYGLNTFYFKSNNKEKTVSTIINYSLLINCLLLLLIFIYSNHINSFLFNDPSMNKILLLELTSMMFFSTSIMLGEVLKVKLKAEKFVILTTIYSVFLFLITLFFIFYLKEGITGVFEARLYASLIYFICSLFFVYNYISFEFDLLDLKNMIKIGFPFFIGLFFLWGIDYLNRFTIKELCSIEDVGLFTMAFSISAILLPIIIGYTNAFIPRIIKLYNEDLEQASKIFYSKMLEFYTILIFFLFTLLFFSTEILSIMGSQYLEGRHIIKFLGLGLVCYGFFRLLFSIPMATGFTKISILSSGIAFLLSTTLNFFLIEKYNILGASISFMLSYFALSAIIYIYILKLKFIAVKFCDVMKIFLVTVLFLFISELVNIINISIFVKVILFFILVIIFVIKRRSFGINR